MSDQNDDISTGQYASDLHRQGEIASAGPKKRPKKWIGRIIGLIFVGGIVGIGIVSLLKFANDPVTGSVVESKLNKDIAPKPIADGTLNGLYVTLKYPGVFNQVSQVKSDSTAYEQYNLGSSSSYRRTITVDIRPSQSGQPHDDSSYRLRQIQSTNYSPSSRVVNGETVSVMTKADGSEISWFWPHSGKMLIVAVTTTEPGDHVGSFSDQVMNSVVWK
jgi:hypothetical protein